MASVYLFRLTKTRQFVLNNHWPHIRVWPKETLFFMPCFQDVITYWKDFLCDAHNKEFLFLHYIHVRHSGRIRKRFLNDDPMLVENLLKAERLVHIDVLKTMKVFNKVPIVWRKMVKIPASYYKDIE